ncbi:MAG: hypothetical protein IKF29_10935 [Oceanobacillus sp.]|nr:hypothetical protein [Oceanobacillus sp.]
MSKVELSNFEDTVNEIRDKIVPQIIRVDMLPGFTRPSLTQIEKHILKLSRNQPADDVTVILFAYGLILGETMIKTIEGSEWNYEAPSLEFLRIKLPISDANGDSISSIPIKRVIGLFNSKDIKNKGIVSYYDQINKTFLEHKKDLVKKE